MSSSEACIYESASSLVNTTPAMHRDANEERELAVPILVGGIVVEGDHRGRELGYPTANVEVSNVMSAPEGVFAGVVTRADGSRYRSAISVGRRETFYEGDAPILVEAFILDFSDDLYGEHLRVEMTWLIRLQARFSSVEELIERIERDVATVRELVNPSDLVAATNGTGHRLDFTVHQGVHTLGGQSRQRSNAGVRA